MTDLELIFIMLGEASTTEIARRKDVLGFDENRNAAMQGGAVAGNARKELETKTGKPVVSRANYLALGDGADVETKKLLAKPGQWRRLRLAIFFVFPPLIAGLFIGILTTLAAI